MKSIQLGMMAVAIFMTTSLFAQTTKKETIKVWGNCSSCKNHIEKAAMSNGVSFAQWNTKTKILTVSYDPSRTSSDAIEKNIAAVGYDTEKFKGDDKAYNNLDDCCKYDRKKQTK